MNVGWLGEESYSEVVANLEGKLEQSMIGEWYDSSRLGKGEERCNAWLQYLKKFGLNADETDEAEEAEEDEWLDEDDKDDFGEFSDEDYSSFLWSLVSSIQYTTETQTGKRAHQQISSLGLVRALL